MIKTLIATSLIFSSFSTLANLNTPLTPEELRIEKASQAMPAVLSAFASEVNQFEQQFKSLSSYAQAVDAVNDYSKRLWFSAKKRIATTQNLDDRALYWARLQSSKIIRTTKPAFSLSTAQQTVLLTLLENGSRGRTDLSYSQNTTKKYY